MHDTSARLVERVLPAASYRQWVLTVPFPLRLGLPVSEPAAVTFVQRFGEALTCM